MVTITHFKFTASTNKSVIMILTSNGRADTSPNPWEFFLELGHPIDELWSVFFLNEVCPTSFVIASQFQIHLKRRALVFANIVPALRPPLSFSFTTISQANMSIFLLSILPPHKNRDCIVVILQTTPFGMQKMDM